MFGDGPQIDSPIGPLPDFPRIYGDDGLLSPRYAYLLWSECLYRADSMGEQLNEIRDVEPLSSGLDWGLPPSAERHLTREFAERLVQCFRDLADRLATGAWGSGRLAACTGDELALQFALDDVEVRVAEPRDDGPMAVFEGSLHDDPEFDVNFYRNALVDDADVLLLYDPSIDGFEADTTIVRQTSVVNLRPSDWFVAF
jgi:hypothetical protein